jgi:flagellar hook-length control protein FliK
MAISIDPILPILPVLPAQEAAAVAPDLVLQPGTVVDATVLKVLAADLVRIAIASLSIDVRSEIPLREGQVLRLAVSQTQDGIRLTTVGEGGDTTGAAADAGTLPPDAPVEAPAIVPPGAPPKTVLTLFEKIAVTMAAQVAATEQDSQALLFANLSAVAASGSLPPKLQQAVTQVLAQQTSLDPNLGGSDVKTAFQKSGLLLEASLASGSVPPVGGVPDLKAALIVLRQALQSALGVTAADVKAAQTAERVPLAAKTAEAAPRPHADAIRGLAPGLAPSVAPSVAQDLDLQEILLPQARVPVADDLGESNNARQVNSSGRAAFSAVLDERPAPAAALNLLQEVLQEVDVASRPPGLPKDAHGGDVTVHTNTPPPPFRGALPSAQPVASPSISPHAPLAATAQHLLGDTDAAIARQTLLQVASLPDRADIPGTTIDNSAPRWNFEIPFATPQGTAMAQFEISRDGGDREAEAAKRVWRARFSLDVEPAGPVHALVSLVGNKTAVRMWAERPATAAQLRAGAAQLSQALGRAELTPGDIVIRDGAPPQRAPARAGHFLDRAL